jgi:lycopene cyclase domain-containing protein
MTYWSLNAVFLAVVAAVAIAAVIARRAPRWRAIGLSAIIVLIMTAVFDNVLVGLGIVGYDESRISGVLIGVAPLEDFAYAIAALILLPSLWTLLPGKLPEERAAQPPASRRAKAPQS